MRRKLTARPSDGNLSQAVTSGGIWMPFTQFNGLDLVAGCTNDIHCSDAKQGGYRAVVARQVDIDRTFWSTTVYATDTSSLAAVSWVVQLGATQMDIFGVEELGWDERFRTAHRVSLDEHSWVEHVPGWLRGSEELLELLRREAGWAQRQRWMINRRVTEPRLTAEYPEIAQAPGVLRGIGAALSRHYGRTYDGLWINLYRDHRDSTSWHADWPSCRRKECVVPVLSLGSPRRFLIRPRGGGTSVRFTPASGDLIVMGGRAQKDWMHMVPKQARPAGPRISVNFTSSEQGISDE